MKMGKLSILFLSLCCILTSQAYAQCLVEFSGIINDADTRQRLSDATVSIKELKLEAKTDSKGEFRFKGLCPGNYTVIITHVSCQPLTAHIHLKEDLHKDFELPHTAGQLAEVVVKGSGAIASAGNITGDLHGKQLDASKGQSLGEALKRITGVTVLQTGNNIYKPVIQGLHSNRVLILNNGIRQEGQQWGSEHAPEVDPYLANRLTVIKGASSIRYGGDAIGGVVLVEPKLLPYGVPGTIAEINTAIFSNNWQGVVSGMVEGSLAKHPAFAWRLQGTAKRGGNARTPDYWLANSGNQELNMSATAGWDKKDKGLELFYSLFSTKIGIFSGSHIGNVTDLINSINNGDPPDYIRNVDFTYAIDRPYQQVQHQLAKAKAYFNMGDWGRLNVIGSFQYNKRREYDVVRTPRNNPQLELSLYTSAVDVVLDHFKSAKWKGSVGVSGMYQLNDINYRFFIPNYQSTNLGVFVAEKYTSGNWSVEAGVRYDWRSINDITDNDAPPYDALMGSEFVPGDPYGTRSFSGVSGNVGTSYKIDNWKFTIAGSSAWRSPQVNELFSAGLHHGAARIETGDPGLQPERSMGAAAAVDFSDSKWDLDVNVYYKRINDFIYLKPTYPPQLTIRGAFPSFEFDQTDARLMGTDIQLSYLFDNHFRLQGKASILRAFDLTNDDWLIQMPSDRYEASAEYLFDGGNKFRETYVKLTVGHVTEQTRVPETGNIKIENPDGSVSWESDYAPPPPAYTLFGFEAGTEIDVSHRKMSIILGVSNIFNTEYRDYMNSFRYFCDDMGRNVSLRIKIPIEFNSKP
jgi:iron complex outermembrane receptor protein